MTAVVFSRPSGMAHLSQNEEVERQADMRQGRSFTAGTAPRGESSRSEVDPNGSSSYPHRHTRPARTFSPARCVNLLGLVGLVALSAFTPGCAEEFDTSRPSPALGTVGEEMFGVI